MWQRVFIPQSTYRLPEYTWDKERELCKRCANYRERVAGVNTTTPNTVMCCVLNIRRNGDTPCGTCIDMRYDGPCGRDGKLFEERK